ncbi:MAG TPA: PQQ-dependent sugar dehydrogenase, partial [Nitrospiria bacterium]|nr:PQQ-dependent sugar dehydrogenase [Nitrospiria bacterium]
MMKFITNIIPFLFCVYIVGWSGNLNRAEAGASLCQSSGAPLSKIDLQLKPLVNHLDQPLGLTHAGDHSGRIFIVEQKGLIWIVKDGKKTTAPFLDLREKITAGGELGLLGLAFHPRFSDNHRFYINYTETYDSSKIRSVIAEYRTGNNPDEADPLTEKVLLLVPQPFRNHKGGNLVFGPDGDLYIGFGDGGSGNDPSGNGQNLGTLLGKMLRIDVDHSSP